MPFTLLAEEFHADPKTVKAGLDGAGLYARALSYCGHYLTDGFVPKAWVSEIARPAVRKKVTAAGFWVEVSGGERYEYVCEGETYSVTIAEAGYFIPDYLAYNPTRASVESKKAELSAKRSAAGKKGAMKRWSRTERDDPAARATKKRSRDVANTAQKAGRIAVEPCADCGSTANLEKHHEDHDAPDVVVWLCRSCHSNRHGNSDSKRHGNAIATGSQNDGALSPSPKSLLRAVTVLRPDASHRTGERPGEIIQISAEIDRALAAARGA